MGEGRHDVRLGVEIIPDTKQKEPIVETLFIRLVIVLYGVGCFHVGWRMATDWKAGRSQGPETKSRIISLLIGHNRKPNRQKRSGTDRRGF
jgi:hypothetical protein